jgi:hypothetical protein
MEPKYEMTAFHLAQLRHVYAQLHAGTVEDQRQVRRGASRARYPGPRGLGGGSDG